MKNPHMRPVTSESSLAQLFRMVTVALVMGIGGLAFLVIVDPAQAEQATSPSASSGKTLPQDQGNMQKRLQSVENELDKLKKEQEIAENQRDALAAMQATQAGEWETKFDLLRRDPRARLVIGVRLG